MSSKLQLSNDVFLSVFGKKDRDFRPSRLLAVGAQRTISTQIANRHSDIVRNSAANPRTK